MTLTLNAGDDWDRPRSAAFSDLGLALQQHAAQRHADQQRALRLQQTLEAYTTGSPDAWAALGTLWLKRGSRRTLPPAGGSR